MSSTSNPNTVFLKGEYITKEGNAGAAITPGHLVEYYLDSGVEKVRVHGTADGPAEKSFAFEHEDVGGGIDDAYAAADRTKIIYPTPGSEIYALVAASASAIVTADFLGSAGDGTVKKVTVGASTLAGSVLAVARESKDNSGGSTPVRIRIAVL